MKTRVVSGRVIRQLIFVLYAFFELLKLKKKKLFVTFVDFEKAFDKVWRDGLWCKLLLNNINGKMYKVIYNMYQNIKSRIVYNNAVTAGNRHKQNSWFCKEIREDNFRFWWRRVHEDASQGMYMSKIEIFLFTARILQNQRML